MGKENIGMHNFVVVNDITTEALINFYPELEKKIDSIDGMFYRETFYDNKRVFFEKNGIVYEYLYEKNKIKKISYFGDDCDIEDVFTK